MITVLPLKCCLLVDPFCPCQQAVAIGLTSKSFLVAGFQKEITREPAQSSPWCSMLEASDGAPYCLLVVEGNDKGPGLTKWFSHLVLIPLMINFDHL